MIKSTSRGHETYFDGTNWRFIDNHEIDNHKRTCKKCGKFPTIKGFDACLGELKNISSACCGHGKGDKIIVNSIQAP